MKVFLILKHLCNLGRLTFGNEGKTKIFQNSERVQHQIPSISKREEYALKWGEI